MRASSLPPRFTGFVYDDFSPDTVWLREAAQFWLPPLDGRGPLLIEGEFAPHPEAPPDSGHTIRLVVQWGTGEAQSVIFPAAGPWQLSLTPPAGAAQGATWVRLSLLGLERTNALAWLGRLTAGWPGLGWLQPFRAQHRNRQVRLRRVRWGEQEVYDFALRHNPFSSAFGRHRVAVGANLIGYFTADLGIGESARCMLRSFQAAGIPVCPIEARLPCKATRTDQTYRDLLREEPEHSVNIFHLDTPAAPHLETHHPGLMKGRYNIGYLAWELPEFPDAWMPYLPFFDEIWTPSEFVRAAIAEKSPVPVLCFPHSITFPRPVESTLQLRTRLGLPTERYLFLFLYDLNSYSERKNAKAVIEAFRQSGLSERRASLIIKVHGAKGNEGDLEALRNRVAGWPGTLLLTEAMPRRTVYELQAACDCFVSLHRSEGFGLAVAESMYLGKPVICTDWSATKEFLGELNGCPVKSRLIMLDQNHGPYSKGQFWADPDIAHAAEWMQRLHDDPSLGHLVGTAARSTIEFSFGPGLIGAKIRRRLETIASW